jgi:hypothetical protein
MHPLRGKERRYIAVRQNIIRRKKAMGKTLPLFVNEIDVRDYRFSAWITNKLPRRKQRGIRRALTYGLHEAYDSHFLAV